MKPEKSSSLHEALLKTFRGVIVSQEWSPGFQLPFETELAGTHVVSWRPGLCRDSVAQIS